MLSLNYKSIDQQTGVCPHLTQLRKSSEINAKILSTYAIA